MCMIITDDMSYGDVLKPVYKKATSPSSLGLPSL